jgi:hypothetical protein
MHPQARFVDDLVRIARRYGWEVTADTRVGTLYNRLLRRRATLPHRRVFASCENLTLREVFATREDEE